MKTLFTKGPWQVKHSESKPAFNVIGTALGGKYKIARCPYVVTGNDKGIDDREMREAEANARLIASAPELLELAKHIKAMEDDAHFCEHPEWAAIVQQAFEVIEKATGEKESNHVG